MTKVEDKGRQNSKYRKFDKYDTATLEAILQADFDAPEAEQMEVEAIIYIANLLAERRGPSQEDVAAAKAEFFKYYYPLADETKSLYDFDDEDTIPSPKAKKAAPLSTRLRPSFVSVAAVLVFFVLFGGASAYALGYDPLAAIAKWTEEQFWFEDVPVTADLLEAVAKYDEETPLVPTWLPEGYQLSELTTVEYDSTISIGASFSKQTESGTDTITMTYTFYLSDQKKSLIEKDSSAVTRYLTHDVTYYLMSNLSRNVIAWYNEDIEGIIIGKFSSNEAKKIINSIYGE